MMFHPAVLRCLLCVLILPRVVRCDQDAEFDKLRSDYQQQVRPLLQQFCLTCHSTKKREGELDLQRFRKLSDVRRDPRSWQKLVQMLDNGEMPPRDVLQPTAVQTARLRGWTVKYLDAEARANAGDPGPVVLRRLNNAEYTYTVRDLTGVSLNPTATFPVDGAAGEGFTNTGQSLVMSPAMVTKYLDAAKSVTRHAVLLPAGMRFSAGTTGRDFTDEILREIRTLYLKYTGRPGDVNSLNRWNVPRPKTLTDRDGRIDLGRYFTALIAHRRQLQTDPDAADDIAVKAHLSARYLRRMAHVLLSDQPATPLLEHFRLRCRGAEPQDAQAIAAEIAVWQESLWKFNVIGHFGSITPWQERVSPLTDSRTFRVKIERQKPNEDVTLFLVAGSAGDGTDSDLVRWQRPRLDRPGRSPILLRDVRAVSAAFQRTRRQALSQTAKHLAAAFEARNYEKPQPLAELADKHGVDPVMLKAWLSYCGISVGGEVNIPHYLTHATQNPSHGFVKGWGLRDVAALSLIANTSDKPVQIPGTMNPHKIAVHPRPERWVAAGWKSPFAGRIRIVPSVQDAHATCGNGVSWALELHSGAQRRVLRADNLDLGKRAAIEPVADLHVRRGDLIALKIGPRDRNHGCDLTEIDLTLTELAGSKRTWSLSADCADTIDAGNPHPDRNGNLDTWHFFTGPIGKNPDRPVISPGSLLARWFEATDAETAAKSAADVQAFLSHPLTSSASKPDAEIHRQLADFSGPLFSRIDFAKLAATVTATELKTGRFGVAPELFEGEDLIVRAPAVIEVRLPATLFSGSELVVTGTLDATSDRQGSVQLDVTSARPQPHGSLLPAASIVVAKGGTGETRFQRSLDQFCELFPAAMCYPQIVPVDEVVTLVLFHREDQHLSRLVLDDAERLRLDRLWNELHYVSRDALLSVDALEQIRAFATQTSATNALKYDPLRKPIADRAAAFRRRLLASEPAHLQALLEFASRAYRRPLSRVETGRLRGLYATLRQQDVSHQAAFRLSLARVLTTPAFLYRLEKTQPGSEAQSVTDWELANRLSYFLWSSLPDDRLRKQAAAGRLREPDVLLSQTRRMIKHRHARRLAIQFACQWLHIRDFDQFNDKSERHFPQFQNLKTAMYEESVRFFTDLFQNDRSVLSILGADHGFLNASLARHYGIPGISGDEWRRVDGLKKFSRGGILGQAATLSKQSGASRTSAILRGNWVFETLLGERLPRPPKDVPQLPDVAPADLTERQLIEQHAANAACAKCHARIDPFGFALEHFDAIGGLRNKDGSGHPIDARTVLADGTQIEGIDGLRQYLLTVRRDEFLRQFCRKLLGYALGRGVQLSDAPLLDQMIKQLAERDDRVSAALEAVVLSDQFRKIRGRDYAGPVFESSE